MQKYEVAYRVVIEADNWREANDIADALQGKLRAACVSVVSVDSGTTLEEVD